LASALNGVIIERVQRLQSDIYELRDLQNEVTFEVYRQDKFKRKFIERTLQTALEACLDIGNRLISVAGLRQPADNRDVFLVMIEAGILPQQRLESFQRMAGFRNILVHEYTKLDDAAVYGVFQKRLDDLTAFAEAVLRYVAAAADK
jgi:uncharacterized protein YutE (UPF0331/DUF86 family)